MKACLFLFAVSAFVFAQAPPPTSPETVVAKVDGKDLTLGELRKMFETYPPQFMQSFQRDPQSAIRDAFLVRYAAGEGDKLKLGEQSPWKEQIEIARETAVAQAMFTHERNFFPVTPEMINSYYERNQARYESATIKVIKIGFKPAISPTKSVEEAARQAFEAAHASSDRSEADARKLAAEIVAKVRAGGDFVALVKQYSDDAESKAADGDFGTVKLTSSYTEEFKKSVLALKPGQVSDPIPSANALYIVRVEKKAVQPMAEVSEQIISELKEAHLGEYLTALSKRFAPVIERPDVLVQFTAGAAQRPAAK